MFKLLFVTYVLFIISCSRSLEKTEEYQTLSTKQMTDEFNDNFQNKERLVLASTPVKGIITSKGFENVTFDMTETEIRAVFEGHLLKDYDPEYPECYYLHVDNADISFMIYSGTLQRIDIYGSQDILTKKGVRIGMSFETVERLYVDTYRKPNFYTYPHEDLFVQLDKNIKLVFEQSTNEIINHFRVGTLPSINFVEGCQ